MAYPMGAQKILLFRAVFGEKNWPNDKLAHFFMDWRSHLGNPEWRIFLWIGALIWEILNRLLKSFLDFIFLNLLNEILFVRDLRLLSFCKDFKRNANNISMHLKI